VVRRRGPLKQQDLGSGSDAPRTELTQSDVVFFVSPDHAFAAGVEEQLQGSGYQSHSAASVAELLEAVQQRPPALVLVDRRIRDWDILRTDRGLSSVPIITMVPFDMSLGDEDVITDLERGADGVYSGRDGHKLFLAVIGSYFRRSGYRCAGRGVYRAGCVELDTDVHEVRIGGEQVPLSAKPFALLEAFMRAPSQVYSRSELLDLVWGPNFAIGDHTLDVHIHTLRQLLDRDPEHRCRLVTIKGVGFKLKVLQPSISASLGAEELPEAADVPSIRCSGTGYVPVAQGESSRLPMRTSLMRVSRRRRAQPFTGTAIVRHLDSSVPVAGSSIRR
jgi:DNA-binding response OmpR family regulator